jgi:hypothetical protein
MLGKLPLITRCILLSIICTLELGLGLAPVPSMTVTFSIINDCWPSENTEIESIVNANIDRLNTIVPPQITIIVFIKNSLYKIKGSCKTASLM